MAEATALIEGVESLERKYSSVNFAPRKEILHLQHLASRLPDGISHNNAEVRLNDTRKTRVTSDYRVFRAWHLLTYGNNVYKLAHELGITPTKITGLRRKDYCYSYHLGNKMHLAQAESVPKLVRRLSHIHVYAPSTPAEFNDAMAKFDEGETSKYPGRCYRVFYMTKLILLTKTGDVHAKIPVSVRCHA